MGQWNRGEANYYYNKRGRSMHIYELCGPTILSAITLHSKLSMNFLYLLELRPVTYIDYQFLIHWFYLYVRLNASGKFDPSTK